jgi:predicted HTH transcriptional regulator
MCVGNAGNKLLFENAKHILTYTGIGSGIMRAIQNYNNIVFKNDFVCEEFVTTILREDNQEHEGLNDAVKLQNERVNLRDDAINDAINLHFEAINDAIKNELLQLLQLISRNPNIKRKTLYQAIKKSKPTIERYLKMLREKGLIEYIGSKKTGSYKISNSKGAK